MSLHQSLPRVRRKRCENTAFPYRHFERKREIFFVRAEMVYACERKREA